MFFHVIAANMYGAERDLASSIHHLPLNFVGLTFNDKLHLARIYAGAEKTWSH